MRNGSVIAPPRIAVPITPPWAVRRPLASGRYRGSVPGFGPAPISHPAGTAARRTLARSREVWTPRTRRLPPGSTRDLLSPHVGPPAHRVRAARPAPAQCAQRDEPGTGHPGGGRDRQVGL